MTVQCPKQFHSFFFFRDQVFASQIKTMEEICWVTPTPLKASFKSPIPYAKSRQILCPKSLFWGTKSLHHRSRLRKRFFGGDTNPFKGQLKSLGQGQTPNQHMKTAQCPKQFFFPSLFGNQVFLSLVQSQAPDQCIKTVQCLKQFISVF